MPEQSSEMMTDRAVEFRVWAKVYVERVDKKTHKADDVWGEHNEAKIGTFETPTQAIAIAARTLSDILSYTPAGEKA